METDATHTTTGNVAAFLYELMRDHLPVGVVEAVVQNSVKPEGHDFWRLTNGHLAMIADRMAAQLLAPDGAPPAAPLRLAGDGDE
jgi:hypothetical protein